MSGSPPSFPASGWRIAIARCASAAAARLLFVFWDAHVAWVKLDDRDGLPRKSEPEVD